MNLASIVREPVCLSYFVQYLETRNALSYIKFYLDTEHFRNAALSQLKKDQHLHVNGTNDLKHDENLIHKAEVLSSNIEQCGSHLVSENKSQANEEYDIGVTKNVPELRILCDLSMHKPITDDEKSQIYAATNKQLTKCYKNSTEVIYEETLKSSNYLSCNDDNGSICDESLNKSMNDSNITSISTASINDALIIYQKYLNKTSTLHLDIPVDIISKISLVLCQKLDDNHQSDTITLHSDSGGECLPVTADCFVEAQNFVLQKLEQEYLSNFLQSPYYCKYCIELVKCGDLHIYDLLHSEVTLFYFMEYLEQHDERDCLDFWSAAFNYRNSYINLGKCNPSNEGEMRQDAMIIYEKFFSLQAKGGLWASSKLRAYVESIICSEDLVCHCFDLPLKVVAIYLERKYLQEFLKSSLFANYVNELKFRIQMEPQQVQKPPQKHTNMKDSLWKGALSRSFSDRRIYHKSHHSNKAESGTTISQQNTLLASMDRYKVQEAFPRYTDFPSILSIDSSEMMCQDLLWPRSRSFAGEPLKFGHINAFGRFERDFLTPSDALCVAGQRNSSQHQWSSFVTDGGNRFKRAMRKLINLPEEKVQEEIAWQVAEMIVKDVTNVTMKRK